MEFPTLSQINLLSSLLPSPLPPTDPLYFFAWWPVRAGTAVSPLALFWPICALPPPLLSIHRGNIFFCLAIWREMKGNAAATTRAWKYGAGRTEKRRVAPTPPRLLSFFCGVATRQSAVITFLGKGGSPSPVWKKGGGRNFLFTRVEEGEREESS